MPVVLTWDEIALRLALTVLAGALIGLNRGERGRPAGLRTTLLVCLAASVAMIQANLLMPTAGKASNSFVVLDLMRLPLGILSGMGFIGAGAILRRDNLVVGITTAATLWFVTVIGLCFGGGQMLLGLAGLALALVILWGLNWIEQRTKRDHRAELVVTAVVQGPSEQDIHSIVLASRYSITSMSVSYREQGRIQKMNCEIEWRSRPTDIRPPSFLNQLANNPGVLELDWKPQST